jgi:7,8-dihydropterin-6-yl-methyl-4-(beta-D-ribofuranosyl)aminobenzene 5'-phosphate synthase
MNTISITILSENTAGHDRGLLGEHGFSALVVSEGKQFLFDTGQGSAILNNMARLGLNVNDLDLIALSHGHWDHSGGLFDVISSRQKNIPVYCHPDVFKERYYIKDEKINFAGIPHPKTMLEAAGADFKFNSDVFLLANNVYLTGRVPMVNNYEVAATQLFTKVGGDLECDLVSDEQSMIIVGNNGLVVLVGCAHPGIINIIDYAKKITGVSKVQAVVGGTHLMFHAQDQITATISALSEISPSIIATAHCTGMKANGLLQAHFLDNFVECKVGTRLCFE